MFKTNDGLSTIFKFLKKQDKALILGQWNYEVSSRADITFYGFDFSTDISFKTNINLEYKKH